MPPKENKKEEIQIGCKFCHYKFSIFEMGKYLNHLWRFHIDECQKQLNEFQDERRRIESIPK